MSWQLDQFSLLLPNTIVVKYFWNWISHLRVHPFPQCPSLMDGTIMPKVVMESHHEVSLDMKKVFFFIKYCSYPCSMLHGDFFSFQAVVLGLPFKGRICSQREQIPLIRPLLNGYIQKDLPPLQFDIKTPILFFSLKSTYITSYNFA